MTLLSALFNKSGAKDLIMPSDLSEVITLKPAFSCCIDQEYPRCDKSCALFSLTRIAEGQCPSA